MFTAEMPSYPALHCAASNRLPHLPRFPARTRFHGPSGFTQWLGLLHRFMQMHAFLRSAVVGRTDQPVRTECSPTKLKKLVSSTARTVLCLFTRSIVAA